MNTRTLFAFLTLMTAGLLWQSVGTSEPTLLRDRSPSDLALLADGHRVLTANGTADTVSLVNLDTGNVLAEQAVGKRPFAVAVAPDGKQAVVTNWLSNDLTVLEVQAAKLRVTATIPVGEEPRGVALSKDGRKAFVAVGGEDVVAVVDLAGRKVVNRIPVGTEPWYVGLTPDGTRLAVGNTRSQDVSVISLPDGKVVHTVKLRGRNVRAIAIAPDGDWAYVPHISEQGRPATRDNINWGWVVANRLSRANLKTEGPREAIALDVQGKAAGDVEGVAVSPDGQTVALTAGGTHELLLLRLPLPFVGFGGPGDHIDPELKNDPQRFRRIPLGGRPLGVQFAPDGKTVVVANYLSNAVQIVDVTAGTVTKTIALGGPETPSPARQGEILFHDATRSFHQWYSCSSCHTEGHTNGGLFDTFNDGSYLTPKKTLSLRGVTKTAPWTWHGWQKDLRALVHDSFTKTMQGPEPTPAELDAVLAYLQTLDWRPGVRRPGTEAALKRGEAAFRAKSCNTCHAAPNYTTSNVYTVGLELPEDVYKGYNPPSLRNVGTRSPYLHDGRVKTLEAVLRQFHRPSELTGQPDFTPDELKDVVTFLKSL